MTTTAIVFILAAIVTVSMVLIVGSQLRERNRIERARRTAALEDSYKRAARLFKELPGQYLTKDLKLLIITQMDTACAGLRSVRAGELAGQCQNEAREFRQMVESDQDKRPPMKVDTPEKSKHIQELLQVLFKMLEAMHKSGKISAPEAKKNLRYVLFLVHKTHVDLHVFQAREHVKQNQIRKAIHEYHLASTEMNKSKDNALAVKAIKSFRTRIRELEEQAREDSSDKTVNNESQGTLDREWDTFLHDEEWKKKADYDD